MVKARATVQQKVQQKGLTARKHPCIKQRQFWLTGGRNLQVPAVTGTLDVYVAEINRFSILTAEEEFRLAVRLKKYNDMEAAEKLVVSNLRFVVKIAHEYRITGSNWPIWSRRETSASCMR